MPESVAAVLYAVVLLTAWASCQLHRPPDPRRPRPVSTVAALVVVGVPTVVQLTVAPSLLEDLRRDRAATASGQVWRVVTSLVVQDGGVAGAVFNLALLAVIGVAAEQVWGSRRWLVLALGAGVGAQAWGWVVQPVGAGNSVVVFGLAASLAVVALAEGEVVQRALAGVSVLGSAALLVTGDIHGGAALIGTVVAVVMLRNRGAASAPR